jgi:uncharacterized protein YkwD
MELTVRRRKQIMVIGLLLAVFMLVGFAAPKPAHAVSSSEHRMAYLINKARAHYGRAGLQVSDTLSNYARRHSRTMAAKNKLYHNPYLADWLKNLSWRILGENVGVGGTVYSLNNAFMASPSHRANNLDRRFRSVGVGIVVSGGRMWVTVIFRG